MPGSHVAYLPQAWRLVMESATGGRLNKLQGRKKLARMNREALRLLIGLLLPINLAFRSLRIG